jgi:hypothetical protein
MNDIDGPFMAERVYKLVFSDRRLGLDEVPYALDAAVRELREMGVPPHSGRHMFTGVLRRRITGFHISL